MKTHAGICLTALLLSAPAAAQAKAAAPEGEPLHGGITTNPLGLMEGNYNFQLELAPVALDTVVVRYGLAFGKDGDSDFFGFRIGMAYYMYLFSPTRAPNGFFVGPGADFNMATNPNDDLDVFLQPFVQAGYNLVLLDLLSMGVSAGLGYNILLSSEGSSSNEGMHPRYGVHLGFAW